jgi:hypothetical protein
MSLYINHDLPTYLYYLYNSCYINKTDIPTYNLRLYFVKMIEHPKSFCLQ